MFQSRDVPVHRKNVEKVPITEMKKVIHVWKFDTLIVFLVEQEQVYHLSVELFLAGPNVQMPIIGVRIIAGYFHITLAVFFNPSDIIRTEHA